MYGSLLGGDETTRLAAAFKADTGIDFDFIAILGGPATTRIREEVKANKAPDIFEASGGWVVGMAPEGVLLPLKDKPLPIWSEPDSVWFTHPGYKAPDDWQHVLSRLRPRGGHILVNTSLLTPADYPKSWHEVATDPKYKGKLTYMDPTATSGLSTEIAMQQYVAKSMTAGDVWGMMASQDTLLFKQARANQTSVAQGERAITWPGGDESILNLVAAGAPIKNLYFPETTYYAMTADMGVLKAAQHPNAALVFINWYLSKPGQEAMSKIQQQSSIRRDVPDYFAEALKGEVVGGGKRGQLIVETPLQSKLATDLQSSGVLKLLVDGSPKDAYESAWSTFVKDWETKNGGAQDKAIVLQR
jgi:ABC-type Fe3+ transport system substrate-binding protein